MGQYGSVPLLAWLAKIQRAPGGRTSVIVRAIAYSSDGIIALCHGKCSLMQKMLLVLVARVTPGTTRKSRPYGVILTTCCRARPSGEAIAASVTKTNRVIVAYEDTLSWGYGAEIAARIADELFGDLDAPVRRVAAMDTFCAYQPKLEDIILPQTEHITTAVKHLLEY